MDGPFDQPTRQFPAERYFPGRKMFGGRFVLERRIGRGGMGEVWLASDNELGRDVALKFAPAEVANDPKSIAELRREVIAGLELSHPRIARVYDLQVDDGEAAISMECVKGKSLSDLQAETEHGFFEPHEIVGWIDDVKDALEYAHTEAKRTHRDVKPKNILVDASTGRAKLVDFGISKRLSDSFTRNTGKDSSGSLAYMSPQQMMGEKNSAEDDWYSLGATVYELLTGAPPFFRGDVRTQIERVVPPSMMERRKELVGEMIDTEGKVIPADWEDWVARMLAKERGRMEEVVKPVAAPPLPPAIPTPPPLPPQVEPRPSAPEPRAVSRAMRQAVVAATGTSASASGQERAEDVQETGSRGDAPKKVRAEKSAGVGELQPITGGQGLAWAGVVAVLFTLAALILGPLGRMADSMSLVLRLTGQDMVVVGVLAAGVWWRFRKHGQAVWKLVGIFVGVSFVLAIGREVLWDATIEGRIFGDMRLSILVNAFLFPLALMISLIVAMGFAFKTWLVRLLIAGVAAGLVASLVEWLTVGYFWGASHPLARYYSSGLLQVVQISGTFFVGAILGVVSGLSMVRSRKVMV